MELKDVKLESGIDLTRLTELYVEEVRECVKCGAYGWKEAFERVSNRLIQNNRNEIKKLEKEMLDEGWL